MVGYGFWDIEARAWPENDLWLGPCPLRAALDADAWLEAMWETDEFVFASPEDLAGLWVQQRNEALMVRAIFAWDLQIEFGTGGRFGFN